MSALRDDVDPDGLLEFSVVFSDRSLNSMSAVFGDVMRDISRVLKTAYNAQALAVVPGGGTYGMEAIARQFAANKSTLIIRNGWFSYRWSQILDAGDIAKSQTIIKASQETQELTAAFAPASIEKIKEEISNQKPDVVFCPHVETSAGILVPDSFIKEISDAVHEAGGLFVLDCVASGTLFVDMEATGVDILLTAPQKGWSASPCAAAVMMSKRGREMLNNTKSSSFANDLKKWTEIMEIYESGKHAYHATMPTDSLRLFRDALLETEAFGLDAIKNAQAELGRRCREVVERYGYLSVAAEGFKAPSVIVSYTDDIEIKTGKKFMEAGMQVAAGVPLECGEPEGFSTFRIGLFGLDKLTDIDRTVENLEKTLETVRGLNS
ncbi:MAG: alanine--glyoxylate aminotransferase family protein [Alphaproteobacteria bacterium]|nr:alanine--glyoxylate aminotransferase family protein [Alphaproteobacteria bacterium]